MQLATPEIRGHTTLVHRNQLLFLVTRFGASGRHTHHRRSHMHNRHRLGQPSTIGPQLYHCPPRQDTSGDDLVFGGMLRHPTSCCARHNPEHGLDRRGNLPPYAGRERLFGLRPRSGSALRRRGPGQLASRIVRHTTRPAMSPEPSAPAAWPPIIPASRPPDATSLACLATPRILASPFTRLDSHDVPIYHTHSPLDRDGLFRKWATHPHRSVENGIADGALGRPKNLHSHGVPNWYPAYRRIRLIPGPSYLHRLSGRHC